MKKYLLGTLAILLAVGFSAFTNSHHGKFDTFQFAHPSHNTSNLTSDWVYHATLTGCTSSSNYCKATFTETSEPADGANPTDITTKTGLILGNY